MYYIIITHYAEWEWFPNGGCSYFGHTHIYIYIYLYIYMYTDTAINRPVLKKTLAHPSYLDLERMVVGSINIKELAICVVYFDPNIMILWTFGMQTTRLTIQLTRVLTHSWVVAGILTHIHGQHLVWVSFFVCFHTRFRRCLLDRPLIDMSINWYSCETSNRPRT